MNLLQVARFPAYPPSSGGENRVHGLVSGRSDDDRVDRFSLRYLRDRREGHLEIAKNYHEYRSRNLPNSLLGFLTDLLDAPQVYLSEAMAFGDTRRLNQLLTGADVVMVEEPWPFAYIAERSDDETPLVYSSHNFELEMFHHLDESRLTRGLLRKVRSIECQAAESADLLLVTSDRDAKLYREHFDVDCPIHVAPNAAYRETREPSAPERSVLPPGVTADDFIASFIGSDHVPNAVAVEHVAEIATASSATRDMEFLIIGSVSDRFEDTSLPPNVHLLGFVDNPAAYYQYTDVALNPITGGAGSNVKLPEYYANGLAVVTTPFGARGMPAEDSKHHVVTDVDGFPDALARLRSDGLDQERLGDNAARLVAERLNWESISRRLFERLHELRRGIHDG